MANIFLSHSTIDGELANYICESFESRGLSCWIAPRNIRPGEDWASSITNAISEADVFFILYSKHSIKSSQCAKEIGIADRKKKYIIPYKIDDTEPEGAFDYYLTGCQWFIIDPSTGEYKMDELCDAIKGVILQKNDEEQQLAEIVPVQNNVSDVRPEVVLSQSAQVKVNQDVIPVQNTRATVKSEVKPSQTVEPRIKTDMLVSQSAPKVVIKEIVSEKKNERAEKTVQRRTTSVKTQKTTRKRTKAQKERRNLLIGGICVLALICIVGVIGITAVIRSVTGNETVSSESGGLFNNSNKTTPAKYFEYKEVDGYIIVMSYTGTDGNVVIPSEIDGKKVMALGGKIFFCNEFVTSVELPETIVEIPTYAFYKCTNLEKVVIPEGVKFIGMHAFEECTSLTAVQIPDSVVTIGDFAFCKCTNLSDVKMSGNVQSIGMYSFSNCETLSTIALPDTLVSVGDMAFAYCTSMKEITIPVGIESISANAFSGCQDITVYYDDASYTNDISAIVEQLSEE